MKPTTIAAIEAHAIEEYPRECCGLVVVRKGRERYVRCRNVAATPEDHFILAPDDYAAAEAQGEVTTIVHSHPDMPARPSEGDRVACEHHGVPWAVVSVLGSDGPPRVAETSLMAPSGYQAPLVGRQWAHGMLDCWALVRDWFGRERGVELPDPPRADGWWDDGSSDLYGAAAMRGAGFLPVATAELAAGDVILMQIRSGNRVPNHAAVYLGDGLILHHLYGRLSSRDVYGGYWAEVTRSLWRYAG